MRGMFTNPERNTTMSTFPFEEIIEACKRARDEVRAELDKVNADIVLFEVQSGNDKSSFVGTQHEELKAYYEEIERKYDKLVNQIKEMEAAL